MKGDTKAIDPLPGMTNSIHLIKCPGMNLFPFGGRGHKGVQREGRARWNLVSA